MINMTVSLLLIIFYRDDSVGIDKFLFCVLGALSCSKCWNSFSFSSLEKVTGYPSVSILH